MIASITSEITMDRLHRFHHDLLLLLLLLLLLSTGPPLGPLNSLSASLSPSDPLSKSLSRSVSDTTLFSFPSGIPCEVEEVLVPGVVVDVDRERAEYMD